MSNGDLSLDIVLISHFLLKPWQLVFIYIKHNIFNWPCLPSLTSKSHYQVETLFKIDAVCCTICLIFSFLCPLKLAISLLIWRKTKKKNRQNMFFILLVWDRASLCSTGWTQSLDPSISITILSQRSWSSFQAAVFVGMLYNYIEYLLPHA